MKDFKDSLVKLGYRDPDLREHLTPLLKFADANQKMFERAFKKARGRYDELDGYSILGVKTLGDTYVFYISENYKERKVNFVLEFKLGSDGSFLISLKNEDKNYSDQGVAHSEREVSKILNEMFGSMIRKNFHL